MIMGKKYIKVPFDVEMAKRISNGEVDGKIITRDGKDVRIVCWDYKSMSGNYPLFALINGDTQEISFTYSEDGKFNVFGYKVEHDLDLMLEIPEYMTFKDGDVIVFGHTEKSLAIGIFHRQQSYKAHECYVKLDWSGGLVYDVDKLTYNNARFATEQEKQKLIKALQESKNVEAKECLKKIGIEEETKYQYKDGDLYMTPNGTIGIYSDKYECGCFMPFHIYMNSEGTLFRSDGKGGCGAISECKPITSATDRIRMVQALRNDENLISKACLKKYFGDEDWIKHIRFKECVLVRGSEQDVWVPAEYGYYSEKLASHVVFNGMGWKHCIPYTIHTKHLMGTTDNWEEIV